MTLSYPCLLDLAWKVKNSILGGLFFALELPSSRKKTYQHVTVAQLVEHGTHKPGVAGSIPARDTI